MEQADLALQLEACLRDVYGEGRPFGKHRRRPGQAELLGDAQDTRAKVSARRRGCHGEDGLHLRRIEGRA